MRCCHCLLIVLACCTASPTVGAAQSSPKPEARTAYELGMGHLQRGDMTAALRAFNQAVTLDQDYVDAFAQLAVTAKAMQSGRGGRGGRFGGAAGDGAAADARILARSILQSTRNLYTLQASLFPTKAIYQWTLGQLDVSLTQEDAERYYRKAVALDAGFSKAILSLASTLAFRGDLAGAQECLRKASETLPKDAAVLAAYAHYVGDSDPDLRRKLTDRLLDLSPAHAAGAELLSRIAVDESDLTARIATLERLNFLYPPDETNTTEWYMRFLFDAYNRTDPIKALALAQEMFKITPTGNAQKDWQDFMRYAELMLQARTLLDRQSYAEAAKLLNTAKPPYLVSPDPQTMLQAKATELAGNPSGAYKIVARTLALQPSDALPSALAQYAGKLKKTPGQVEQDIWNIRRKNSDSVQNFTLIAYRDAKKVRLSDYRGRVVLVNFWNQDSTDCRDEFPQLQKMLDKYGPQGFTIITINVQPRQDAIALVLMAHYGFVSLRVPDAEWAVTQYGIDASPTNVLIDRQGRAVFWPAFWGFDPRHAFELELQALLARGPKD
jgi:Tfp pilus assembly protein PilF/thiol-disulfide isomerase/thioredoxin